MNRKCNLSDNKYLNIDYNEKYRTTYLKTLSNT